MRTVFVRPGVHEIVLMPERNMAKLPAEGALVELSPYWRGRLRDGDVIEVSPASADAPAAPATRSSKK
jgi:hypothetical protein